MSQAAEPETNYRALSSLAILSLLMGIVSFAAVLSLPLTLFALAAIGVGFYAQRHVAINSDRLTGRSLAIAGICLALLFLGWGVSREISRQVVLRGQAREFADDWLQLVKQNEAHRAHQLQMESMNRLDPALDMKFAYIQSKEGQDHFRSFISASPMRELLLAAPNITFKFVGIHRQRKSGNIDELILHYTYETIDGEKKPVWIRVSRTLGATTGKADWQIEDIVAVRPYAG